MKKIVGSLEEVKRKKKKEFNFFSKIQIEDVVFFDKKPPYYKRLNNVFYKLLSLGAYKFTYYMRGMAEEEKAEMFSFFEGREKLRYLKRFYHKTFSLTEYCKFLNDISGFTLFLTYAAYENGQITFKIPCKSTMYRWFHLLPKKAKNAIRDGKKLRLPNFMFIRRFKTYVKSKLIWHKRTKFGLLWGKRWWKKQKDLLTNRKHRLINFKT